MYGANIGNLRDVLKIMGCCGKAEKILKVGTSIVIGYTNLARGKKYEFTDSRIRICQQCKPPKGHNYWIGRTLWCSICKCYIPAKARVKDEKCPLGKWGNGDGK